MNRYIFAFYCIIFVWSTNIYSQEQDEGLRFWENEGLVDVTPCSNELGSFREQNSACQVVYRGKQYASLFIPSESDSILTVRINLIFIQKDDGSGNFQEDNHEHQEIFDMVMEELNQKMSSLKLPGSDCFFGTDDDIIHDTRIRFVDRRYYIKNSAIWNNQLNQNQGYHLCPSRDNWFLRQVTDSIHNSLEDSIKGINIFFTEDSLMYHHYWVMQNLNDTLPFPSDSTTKAACSEWPDNIHWDTSSSIHMPCLYSKYWRMKYIVPQLAQYNYKPWEPDVKAWLYDGIAKSLVHELGHSFFLYHPEDDYNNPSAYNSYPSSNCWNTIMQPNGDSPRDFLPPQEIGLMYVSSMITNVEQFIPISTYLGIKMLNTTLSLPRMRMYYSLEIGSSGNVSLPCNMIFSPKCHIMVHNGGILTIENATLQAVHDSWEGIVVQSGGSLILSNTNIGDYNIIVKSGGRIIIRNNLTITGDHSIQVNDGGYICINDDASINLADPFSSIVISHNAIWGCPSCSDNCITSYSNLIHSGNGCIVTYQGTNYIQNITISTDTIVTGNDIYAGYDVTNTQPVGNVVVESNGDLRIKANQTTITRDVDIKLGGRLLIGK